MALFRGPVRIVPMKFVRFLTLLAALIPSCRADAPPQGLAAFKTLTLEELSQIEVTTPSKEPVRAFQTPAAIYIITSQDIQRSGASSLPEALRLAPGVDVARIDS